MFVRAPTAHLNNLVNGISAGTLYSEQEINPGTPANGGSNTGGLRMIRVAGFQEGNPAEYMPAVASKALANAAIAALVNTATGVWTPPAGFAPVWIEIPQWWIPTVLGTSPSNCPQSGSLQISQESILNAQGGWASFLQSIGWTQQVPTVNGPVPVLAG